MVASIFMTGVVFGIISLFSLLLLLVSFLPKSLFTPKVVPVIGNEHIDQGISTEPMLDQVVSSSVSVQSVVTSVAAEPPMITELILTTPTVEELKLEPTSPKESPTIEEPEETNSVEPTSTEIPPKVEKLSQEVLKDKASGEVKEVVVKNEIRDVDALFEVSDDLDKFGEDKNNDQDSSKGKIPI